MAEQMSRDRAAARLESIINDVPGLDVNDVQALQMAISLLSTEKKVDTVTISATLAWACASALQHHQACILKEAGRFERRGMKGHAHQCELNADQLGEHWQTLTDLLLALPKNGVLEDGQEVTPTP